MSKIELSDWAFGLIPEQGRAGRIVALFGTVPSTGKFFPGSGRIVSYDPETSIATSESGTEYVLREPDRVSSPELLQAAIKKYSKVSNEKPQI